MNPKVLDLNGLGWLRLTRCCMADKFQKRVEGRGSLRAVALRACLLAIVLSVGWLYAPAAIPIEELEHGASALIRLANQPLPISVTGTAIQNPESSEIHHVAAETEPISKHSEQWDKRRRLALAGTLMLILFMIAWRGSRPSASPPPNRHYVRTPPPIPAALLGDNRPRVGDRSHLTEYKTRKILPPKPVAVDGRAEEPAEYRTTKILPAKLLVSDDRNGAQETEVIYLTDPSGMGEVEIGRESPDLTDGVRIKDKTNTVSRRQARIVYSAQTREFRLVNLVGKDSNPTAINGRRMTNQETVLLGNDDILQMGTIQLKFCQ